MSESNWIAALKPGDVVGVRFNPHRGELTWFKVTKRTPAGMIDAVNDAGVTLRFRADGSERGKSGRNWKGQIVTTPERVRRQELGQRLHRTQWSAFPLATLEQITALLPENQP